jgi:hypothetical protein
MFAVCTGPNHMAPRLAPLDACKGSIYRAEQYKDTLDVQGHDI